MRIKRSESLWAAALLCVVSGCGGNASIIDGNAAGSQGAAGSKGSAGSAGFGLGSSGSGQSDGGSVAGSGNGSGEQNIDTIRVEASTTTLEFDPSKGGEISFRVFAKMKGSSTEVELTERSVFWIPKGYELGEFAAGSNVFHTSTTNPSGGALTIEAIAANSDGSTTSIRTTVQLKLKATIHDPRTTWTESSPGVWEPADSAYAIPADSDSLFANAPADSSRLPEIVYPNDGALFPPNLSKLEVHFLPGDSQNELFEVGFKNAGVEMKYLMRCGTLVNNGCVFELGQTDYAYLAGSSKAYGPVTVSLRATNDSGDFLRVAASTSLEFAQDPVYGGLYYWNVKDTSIMRVDFGIANAVPETFMKGGSNGLATGCVGCHAISRDGTKMASSIGGQNSGYQVFVNDLSKEQSPDGTWLTKNKDSDNRFQFASFNPDGTRFVSNYGDGNDTNPNRNRLWMNDGTTGERIASESIDMAFEVDHPAWSPDGDKIAMTRVDAAGHNTSQMPYMTSVSMIKKSGADFSDEEIVLVPYSGNADPFVNYNPDFAPNSKFVIYSQSQCNSSTNKRSSECNADCDPSARSFAITAQGNQTPIELARANRGGKTDNMASNRWSLMDTFPRFSPFESKYSGGSVYWVTVASHRNFGLVEPGQNGNRDKQWLWMFAIDPAKIEAGEDGSFPAFFLPFQDRSSSNHIGQWAEKIVSKDPRPEPPKPPDAPSGPPVPPAPPEIQ